MFIRYGMKKSQLRKSIKFLTVIIRVIINKICINQNLHFKLFTDFIKKLKSVRVTFIIFKIKM